MIQEESHETIDIEEEKEALQELKKLRLQREKSKRKASKK